MRTTPLLSFTAATVSVMCVTQVGAQQPTPVRVDTIASEQVQQVRQVTGNVRAVTRSRVAVIESGRVIELDIEEGETVAAGQKLAKIDSRRIELSLLRLQADLAVQEAMLDERTAQVELRQADLNLLESMQDRGAVNPKELNDARLELKVALARQVQAQRELDVIQADLALLQQRLDDTIITAPFDGVVINRLTERGEWVAEGAAILELASTGHFDVWLDVPQRLARAVSASDLSIMVNVDAVNRSYESTNIRKVGDVDASSRTFSLIARVDDELARAMYRPDRDDEDELGIPPLSPGMSATAWIPTDTRGEQLTLHKDAVLRDDGGAFVFVVRESSNDQPSQAMRVGIDVLFSLPSPSNRLVVRGPNLSAGERVVIEGNERLHPMAAVRVVDTIAQSQSSTSGRRVQ